MKKNKKEPVANTNKGYIQEYLKNEADANKKITNALSLTAVLLTFVWILYLVPSFLRVTNTTRIVTCIVLPIFILLVYLFV